MKVVITIYGEEEFEEDTLESRLVPVFIEKLKTDFEKNNVPTLVIQNDRKAPKRKYFEGWIKP